MHHILPLLMRWLEQGLHIPNAPNMNATDSRKSTGASSAESPARGGGSRVGAPPMSGRRRAYSASVLSDVDAHDEMRQLAVQVQPAAAVVLADLVSDSALGAALCVHHVVPKVRGWGVYCCDFLLLPVDSCCSQCLLLVSRRSTHTPRHKLPPSPTVSQCLQPV